MSQPPKRPKAGRHKVRCVQCNHTFNFDFKKKHEEKQHGGKSVRVVNIGAPANPFELASRQSSQWSSTATSSSTSTTVKKLPETSITLPSAAVIQQQSSLACEVIATEILDQEWIECAGHLGNLLNLISDGKHMLNKIQNDSLMGKEVILVNILDFTEQVKDANDKILQKSFALLKRIQNRPPVTVDDSSTSDKLVEHDPGKRDPITSDAQRRYLIALGPHRPMLSMFPVDGKGRRFSAKWYDEFPHLEYSVATDHLYCFICSLFPNGVGREHSESSSNWFTEGVTNWSKMKSSGKQKGGKLPVHFSSASHKAALADYTQFIIAEGHIDMLLSKECRMAAIEEQRQMAHNSEVIKILLDITATMSKQGLAFRGSGTDSDKSGNFYQITMLLSRHIPTLQRWLKDTSLRPYHVSYLSGESQNEFIHLIGSSIHDKVIEEIQDSPWFTITADTTPDASHKDMLAIVIRTVDENCIPRERLLEICESKDKTGRGLATTIMNVLSQNQLNIENLAFQSYDSASSMSGEYQGVQKYISSMAKHYVPYVPCQAHRCNIAVEKGSHASIIIANLFNTLEELYVFFTSSTKRFQPLKEKISEVENALLLRKLSQTRWTARAEAIAAVNSSFEIVINLLSEISTAPNCDTATKTKAFGLRKSILTFDFIVSLMFMKNIMWKLKVVTELLQSPNLNVIDAISIIESAVKSLQLIRNNSDDQTNLIKSAADFAATLEIDAAQDFHRHHRRRLRPRRLDDQPETEGDANFEQFFRVEFGKVLDMLIYEFQTNITTALKGVKPLFDLFQLPLSRDILTEHCVTKIIEMIPKPSDRPDANCLITELEVLFDNCPRDKCKTFSDVISTALALKNVLPSAFRMCQLCATVGFSVASDERMFSQLKLIKGALRSTMGDARLNNLMLIRTQRDLIDSINFAKLIKSWSVLKKRRIRV